MQIGDINKSKPRHLHIVNHVHSDSCSHEVKEIPQAPQAPEKSNGLWDRIAVFLASVCAIHCLLLPLVLVALPWLEGILPHNLFHVVVLGLTVPLAIVAFAHGHHKHHSLVPMLFGTLGVLSLVAGIMVHHTMWAERMLSIGGSVLLLIGHGQNIRRCRCHAGHKHS